MNYSCVLLQHLSEILFRRDIIEIHTKMDTCFKYNFTMSINDQTLGPWLKLPHFKPT